MSESTFWRQCSSCKKSIMFNSVYWVCNVSTCNQRSHSFVFCSVDCWDAHVPTMRHKNAWAEERQSPKTQSRENLQSLESNKRVDMTLTADKKKSAPTLTSDENRANQIKLKSPPAKEVLVVASKVKAYVRARSDLNTSAAVMDILSDRIRSICDAAIHTALSRERKTVLDRDVP